ncbi:MAG: hypothetical protein ACT4PL_07265 [Phycisphaerales bacterium]
MAIEGLIGTLLGGYTTIGGAQRAAQRDVRAGGGTAGDPGSSRGGVFGLALRAPTIKVNSPQGVTGVDRAEVSPNARVASLLAGSGGGEGPSALVESFVRQRATFAYRSPQVQGRASFDLSFDVEVAYRVVQLVPAGSVVDVQG